jgi:hypothetical protein
MKSSLRRAVLVMVPSLLCSCNLFDGGTSWRSGRFQVEWVDVAPSNHLAYRLDSGDSIGIVGACVFAAGANAKYVVVRQRPALHPATVRYFILPAAGFDPLHPQKHLIGPLTASAYGALAMRLPLPPLVRVVPHSACIRSAR